MTAAQQEPTRRLIAVIGPTATGKTELAIRVAGELGGEAVNADSRQVYRGMDIGTAKPTAAEQARVPHHLIDIADPNEPFNLSDYLQLARDALESCWSRGAVPVLVGGTGQYIWALLEGWQVPRVPPDAELRAELEARAEREGPQALLDELRDVDPAYAATVDASNLRRVIRALEVYQRTGRPLSECRTRQPPDWKTTVIGLTCDRQALYGRIDRRVDAMMEAGLLDEVRALNARGYGCELPAMSGIGYRQVCQHLAGALTLDEAIERIKTATHRLVRRQGAWFRRDDDRIRWIDATDGDPFPQSLRAVESDR